MEHNFPNTFFKHSNGVSTHATIIRFDKKLQKVQSDVTQNLNPKLNIASTKKKIDTLSTEHLRHWSHV